GIFPVLGRVETIAQAPVVPKPRFGPRELRTQVFAALRELLTRLAMRRPLVLLIEDLHWSDADSLALLEALLRPPDAPALLLCGTVGAQDFEPGLPGDVRWLPLQRLPPEDARALTQELLRGAADAAAIARAAEGHPLFITELVRHARAGPMPGDGSADARFLPELQLEEALWSRIERLRVDARRLVELLAVAGGPLTLTVAAQAAGLEPGEFTRHAATVRAANLVRTSGVRRTDAIAPYHDRVRAAALTHLSPETQREWHERLAVALESTGDAEARASHWRAAGQPERAALAALAAAA